MAGMAATEATAITGTTAVIMATVIITIITGIIITAIAITSTFITAAGNGAPTARSTSATAIDSRRRKETRPGREARASFSIP